MSIRVSIRDRWGTREAGFTLIEMLVTMTIMSLVMGAAMTAFLNASRLSQRASATLSVNRDLGSTIDLIVRDLTQVGQGLPNTKVMVLPNGAGATRVNRPGPPGSVLQFPAGATEWPSVLPGPALGPTLGPGGPNTDVLTVVLSDSLFLNVGFRSPVANVAADGASMTVTAPATLEIGDVVLFENNRSAVQVVTGVAVGGGGVQAVQFAAGDPLNLNQRGAADGTILTEVQPTPNQAFTAEVTRLRVITYYVDANRQPPALIRCLSAQCAGATPQGGQVVAFGVENFQVSYDLMNGATNPANVRMTATDQAGGGACGADPCSPNQIRKVNLFLAMRSRNRLTVTNDFVHRSLSTQISLRNLSFVDRYPA